MTNYAQSLQAVHDLAQRSGAAVGVALLCSARMCGCSLCAFVIH